jgi:hypothetical protein
LILQERVCSASSRNFETNLRRERQLEGVAKAKAAGVYKGRPAQIDADQVRKMKADGMGPTEIAEALKIGRASVYRVLARLNLSLLLAEFRDRRLAESRRSSWYPTMRIFQQGAVGDWNGALDRLRQELIGVARRGARRL